MESESDHTTMLHQAEQKEFNLDLVIDQIGQFGKFQFKIFSLICISSALATTYAYLYIFTAGEMDYRCRIPGCDISNASFETSFLNFTIPVDEDGFSKCEKFQVIPNGSLMDQCEPQIFDHNIPEQCSEFIYQGDETTILSEWNLGCNEDWKLSLVGTINNIGQLVCLPLSGYISDRFGRQKAFMWSAIFAASLGLIRSFSTNYTMFTILEFLEPALGSGICNTGFVLALEHIGTKKRVFWAFFPCISCSLGLAGLGIAAMLAKNWRLLMRILYIPAFFFIAYNWLIPESPRWLVRKDRIKEAAKIIESSAKLNGTQLSPDAKEMLNRVLKDENIMEIEMTKSMGQTKEKNTRHHLKTFLKSRTMIIRFINCSFSWAVTLFVYNGLNMTAVVIDGDKYVNFTLNCLIEIPACIFGSWLMEKIGRRRVLCSSFLISGATCIAYIFFKENTVLAQVLFLIGKMNITMTYLTIMIFTTELFPTELRQSSYSGCAVFGQIGAILAPFTLYLGKYMESMEMILFAAMSIPAGILILFTPETLNKPLPDTIQEAENLNLSDPTS